MHTVVENRRAGEADATLPTWIVAPILLGLTAYSAVLVWAGWLMMTPADTLVAARLREAKAAAPRVDSLPGRAEIQAPGRVEEPDPENAPLRPPTVQLRRQMPSIVDRPTVLAEQKRGTDFQSVLPPAPRLASPIRWRKEASTHSSNLLIPIEVAKIDDDVLPYRLRRLHFADAPAKPLRLAVTPVGHDDLGRMLTTMGEGYRFKNIGRNDLLSLAALRRHDVVFLTCTDLYAEDFQAALPLRGFVAQGGTLYASDLCGDLVLAAFPEFRARVPLAPGIAQTIEARVSEPGLQSHLGMKAIPLCFDAPDWRPAAFDPAKVNVCLSGVYRSNLGQALAVPLLVKFRFQKGTVVFTSFHHTKNDSVIVKNVLDYLIFATVNARGEARMRELMRRSGFAPTDLHPAALNDGQEFESVHQHAGGDLQFALGFEHLGAKLKMTLRAPSGQTIEHEDQGVYLVEIPAAERGAWRCTVTPRTLPYDNFPVIVAAGAAKS